MLTSVAVLLTLSFVALTVWTIAMLLAKKDSEKLIRTELINIFEISKMLLMSVMRFIKLLFRNTVDSSSDLISSGKRATIDEQLLNFVPSLFDKEDKNKAA